MLDLMRRNANSWLMVILFSIIIFVFALNFGPWAGHEGGTPPFAAQVNGRAINFNDFQSAYGLHFRQMQQYRPGYTAEQAEQDGLKNMVLGQLVDQELLTQLAEKNGLVVSDEDLAKSIQTRIFGKREFSRDEYRSIVQGVFQTTEPLFENRMRRELLAEQMAQLIGGSAYVSAQEVKDSFISRHTKANLEYVKINPEFFAQEMAISDAQASQFAQSKPKEIEQYYNEHIQQFRTEKQVRARHILIRSSTPDAESKIEAIRKRVVDNKEDFAKVAKETSEDSSKESGGDLGYFGKGMMVKPFEEAAFNLNPGEISKVVESTFGFHIIKVEDSKPEVHRKLEEVRMEIAKTLIKAESQKKEAALLASQLQQKLKAGAALKSMDSKAVTTGETGMVSGGARFIPGIGADSKIAAAAFKLTKPAQVDDQVYEVNGSLVLLRLKALESPNMADLDKEKETIQMSLVYVRRRAMLTDYLAALKKKAKIKYDAHFATNALARGAGEGDFD